MADFTQALSLVALIAAALEYAILVRHREEQRDALRFQAEARDALAWGHRFDNPPPKRRWVDGTRFRLER